MGFKNGNFEKSRETPVKTLNLRVVAKSCIVSPFPKTHSACSTWAVEFLYASKRDLLCALAGLKTPIDPLSVLPLNMRCSTSITWV